MLWRTGAPRFVSSATDRWTFPTCAPFSTASTSGWRSHRRAENGCSSASMTSAADNWRGGLTGQALTEVVAHRLCAADAPPLVGRFVVDAIIGEGGSGRVLRARHALLGFPLALKMLSHAHAGSPDATQAFVREASVLVQLDHPGIVRVLDAFEAHGTFFIVMPWLAGATL